MTVRIRCKAIPPRKRYNDVKSYPPVTVSGLITASRYQQSDISIVDIINWKIKYAHLFIVDLPLPMHYTDYFSIKGEAGNLIFMASSSTGDHQMFICNVVIDFA